ncbi:MAG: hypothetical protein ACOX6N_05450 [Patescibacteria group bacterium]|jgi:uncharacterized repeat protein (TIGR01451 family)
MKKITKVGMIIAALVVLVVSLLSARDAEATYYVPRDIQKSVSVDKKIRPINSENYQDNIDSSNEVFFDSDVLEFKISVENNGKETLHNLVVEDQLPLNSEVIFAPGEWDKANNKIRWTLDKLEVSEKKNFLVRVKIVNTQSITNVTKRTNIAIVDTDGVSDRDDATYFIGISTVPKTGDTTLTLKTVLVLMGTAGGIVLRKYSRGY